MTAPAFARPSWDTILSMIVLIISCLATCIRLQVGALLWNPTTKKIVAIGYNGSPSGMASCLDAGCQIEDNHCVRSVHADTNVCLWAGQESYGCHMYLTHNPCRRCCNVIIQSRVKEVIYITPYGNPGDSHAILAEAGIKQRWLGTNPMVQALLTLLKASGMIRK